MSNTNWLMIKRGLLLTAISLLVYVFLRYFFYFIFPFLTACAFMRMLLPATLWLQHHTHLRRHTCSLIIELLFLIVTGGILFLFFWKLFCQLQLLLTNAPSYWSSFYHFFQSVSSRLCRTGDHCFSLADGSCARYLQEHLSLLSKQSPSWISTHLPGLCRSLGQGLTVFFMNLFLIVMGMLLLCKDLVPLQQSYRRSLFYPLLHPIGTALKKTGITYLKAQGSIMLINWVLCVSGLLLLHNPYAILIGFGIALVDALPILGSGTILLPWAIFVLLRQNYLSFAVLLLLFLITFFVREYLEAHMMGNGLDLSPFYMTAAIYIGLCLYGIWGIFAGPFSIILIRAIYHQLLSDSQATQKSPPAHQSAHPASSSPEAPDPGSPN